MSSMHPVRRVKAGRFIRNCGMTVFSAAWGSWSLKRCVNPGCGLVWLDPMPLPEDIGKAYANYYYARLAGICRPEGDLLGRIFAGMQREYLANKFNYGTGWRSLLQRGLGRLLYLFPVRAPRGVDGNVCRFLDARPGAAASWRLPLPQRAAVSCHARYSVTSAVCWMWVVVPVIGLMFMRGLGWKVSGNDFDANAVKTARDRGLDVECASLEQQNHADGSFDAVTLSHVIEHVPNPIQTLVECRRILKPGGKLVLFTPNASSLSHRVFKQDWRGLEPPRHLHIFSTESMRPLLERAGFQNISVRPHLARSVVYESLMLRRGRTASVPEPRRSSVGRSLCAGVQPRGTLPHSVETFRRRLRRRRGHKGIMPGELQMNSMQPNGNKLRLLVTIASFGDKNLGFLKKIIQGYRSMPMEVDVVVLSNAPKDLGEHVKVLVGLPTNDPWSLPFAHKPVLAENADRYDLFIYTEDDMDVTERNLQAFLDATPHLAPTEIAGFLRYEIDKAGEWSFPDVHGIFRWKPETVERRGSYAIAEFSNEHAAFFILTRQQLKQAIASGGFLRSPCKGRYDMACTAATDPYLNCGFRKVICISTLDDFLIHHMSNRYVGQLGPSLAAFKEQVAALLNLRNNGHRAGALCASESRVLHGNWSKHFYEHPNDDLLKLIPPDAKTVLSIGCGWGATEARLQERGAKVTALPLDSIIGAAAALRGIEFISGTLDVQGLAALAGRKFDCVLVTRIFSICFPTRRPLPRLVSRFVGEGGALVSGAGRISTACLFWSGARPASEIIRNCARSTRVASVFADRAVSPPASRGRGFKFRPFAGPVIFPSSQTIQPPVRRDSAGLMRRTGCFKPGADFAA